MSRKRHVAIIGAGLQGCLLALRLAAKGARVTLLDQAANPLDGASRYNEGKIHLGYIFAKDSPGRTGRLMIEGATRFLDDLAPFVCGDDVASCLSDPFLYKVPTSSMVAPDALAAHYGALDDMIQDSGRSYLGEARIRRVERLPDPDPESGVQAIFATPERAIDPAFLCDRVLEALHACPDVDMQCTVDIVALSDADHHAPWLHTAEGETLGPFDTLVNCAWESRLALDQTLGHVPAHPHLHRLKLSTVLALPAAASAPQTVTLVLGAYGDCVRYPSNQVYLSWYPVGLLDRSADIAPPASWRELPSQDTLDELVEQSLVALAPYVDGLDLKTARTAPRHCMARPIFSWGHGDITLDQTQLHERFDVGIRKLGPAHLTIDTGKLTTAPLFARRCADLIMGD